MKDRIILLAVSGLLSLITGCASSKQYVHFPDQNKAIENPELARIYVVRPTADVAAVSMKISDGDNAIGTTGPKGFLCWERIPGSATIISTDWGKTNSISKLALHTAKGHVYYIQQNVRLGVLKAHHEFTLLSEEDGKAIVSKCNPPKE